MDSVTPWAFCIGIFLIYPAVAFAAGFYIGRRGLPFKIERNPDFGRRDYGVGVE